MCDPKHIQIADYNYPLPDNRIAKFPLEQRDQSKLLVYNHGKVSEDVFTSLPSYLPKSALMVFNNTKVIQARLHFRKDTGALIEVFCLEPALPRDYALIFQTQGHCSWLCLVGNLKKWKEGTLYRSIIMPNGKTLILSVLRGENHGTSFWMDFDWSWKDSDCDLPTWAEVLDAVGELPIPPYLNRETQESDKRTYQTGYSKIKGSVAAPTAGLHFTENVLKALDKHGIDREEITLHVGAGTFKPVKSKEIEGHEMHTEHVAVHKQTIEKLIKHEGWCIAVGTTSVRTLESLYYMGILAARNPNASEEELHIPQWMPYETKGPSTLEALNSLLDYMNRHELDVLHSSTQIIIAPGYEYHIVRMMITNFHQPQSTLLLLVSAFVKGDWKTIYDFALTHDFRFLSYGDSSLLIP